MNTQSKLTILGTCSGTEPMPGRHHTSFTLLHDQRLYWFDAGESCSYTAHQAGPKTIVYSGDVKGIRDIDGLIDGADLLLMETGHHKADQVCQYLKDSDESFAKLIFLHHGRAILADPARELATAQSILGDKVQIADDGMELYL